MASKVESLAQEFLDSVCIGGYVPGEKTKSSGGRKRATHPDSDKPKKTAKTADVGDMQDIAANGKVSHISFTFGLSNLIIVLYKGQSESKENFTSQK
jgi:hypothetical protein